MKNPPSLFDHIQSMRGLTKKSDEVTASSVQAGNVAVPPKQQNPAPIPESREVQIARVREAMAQKPPSQMSRDEQVAYAKSVMHGGSPTPKKEDGQNILQQIVQPFTDTLATGVRTAQGLAGLTKAGIQATFGDRSGAEQTIMEAGRDVEKPVNIPLLGKGQVRRIGTVTESGAIAPSSETLKTVGTGLELGSFFTPIKAAGGSPLTKVGGAVMAKTGKPILARVAGTTAKYGVPSAMTGFAAGTGSALAEGKGVGESLKEGLMAAPLSGVVGTAIPLATRGLRANKLSAKGKELSNRIKAENVYRDALGLTKAESRKEIKSLSKAAKFGTSVRNIPKDLLDEGIELKAAEDAGRRIFDTADNVLNLQSKIDDVENKLSEVIASRGQKTFNLHSLALKAKQGINNLEGITAIQKKAMTDKLDDIVQAELVANGWKAGDRVSMGRAAQVHGTKLQDLKRGLYKMANYERDKIGSDQHVKELARVIRESLEDAYKGTADIASMNKRIGKLVEMSDFLSGMHGKVVKGGYLGRRLGGGIGVLASQAMPLPPILREMAGYKVGEKISDYIDDPARKTREAIKLLSKKEVPSKAKDSALRVLEYVRRGGVVSPGTVNKE